MVMELLYVVCLTASVDSCTYEVLAADLTDRRCHRLLNEQSLGAAELANMRGYYGFLICRDYVAVAK